MSAIAAEKRLQFSITFYLERWFTMSSRRRRPSIALVHVRSRWLVREDEPKRPTLFISINDSWEVDLLGGAPVWRHPSVVIDRLILAAFEAWVSTLSLIQFQSSSTPKTFSFIHWRFDCLIGRSMIEIMRGNKERKKKKKKWRKEVSFLRPSLSFFFVFFFHYSTKQKKISKSYFIFLLI